jgi:C4-dicarboxylate transporter, DctM subunit
VSINELFLAGLVPGLLMIGILGLYSMWTNVRLKITKVPFDIRKARSALREAAWEVPLPFVIVLGIFFGLFTVTEAAAVTVVYVLIIESWVYKEIHPLRDLPKLMIKSMVLVGTILIILGTAMGFTSYLVDEQVPMQVLDFMRQYIDNKWTFLIVLNVLLLIVGCMMEIFSALIVVVPLIIPIAKSFDVNMVHLGIIFLTNLEIGYSTPPVGINLFIASSRFSEPVLRLYRAALPFLGLRLAGLLLITYFPSLSLFLVDLFQR